MPVQKVGHLFRWGNHGKLYRSKKKARIQGIAITISKLKQRGLY